MSDTFDPYYTWLGIPPEEQPADYYKLLGIRRFENNQEVISNALRQRETYIRSFQSGPRAAVAAELLDELAGAGEWLLNPEAKGAYDRELRSRDAPKLTSSGNRPPGRPDAPHRPAPLGESGQPSFGLVPMDSQFPAAQVYSTQPGELLPAEYTVHVPVYSAKPRQDAGASAGRMVMFGAAGALLCFLLLVVVGGIGFGAWALLGRLPVGSSLSSQGNTSLSSDSPKRIELVTKDKAAGALARPAAKGSLRLVVGEPRDLLAEFNPQRHSRTPASLEQEGGGWSTRGQQTYESLFFPGPFPEEYVLETTLTLLGDSKGIIQGLVGNGKQFHITIDGFEGETDGRGMRTALELIDGRRPHAAPNYPCEYMQPLLRKNRATDLRYVVLKDRILLECDGKVVVDWTGGMHRVSTHALFPAGGDPRSLYWGTWQTRCRLSKFVVRPILDEKSASGPVKPAGSGANTKTSTGDESATRIVVNTKSEAAGTRRQPTSAGELRLVVDEPRDLLAQFDPARHCKPAGRMTRDGDGWAPIRKSSYEAMFFSGDIPEEYVLETTLTLQTHSLGIVQGLVAGGKQCHISLDGFERNGQGMKTALEFIDGRSPHDTPDHPCMKLGKLLTLNQPAELRYVVLKNRILVECDGRVVLDWQGGLDRVSTNKKFVAGDNRSLYWGTWQTRCRLSKFILRPILEVG